MNGVLVVDKPEGVSSAHFSRQVGRLLGVKKIGHTGTLDPFASGVLPLCLGGATKISPYLVALDRAYEATVFLGRSTDTYDREGQAIFEGEIPKDFSLEKLHEILNQFQGILDQFPPAYSAKKIAGIASYELARSGKSIPLPKQQIHIAELTVRDFTLPHVQIYVACSKGTYIRSLAYDLGVKIGCGAHLSSLRRARHGQFTLERALSWEDLLAAQQEDQLTRAVGRVLYTADEALSHFPGVEILADDLNHIRHGKDLNHPRISKLLSASAPAQVIKILDPGRNLVALVSGRKTQESEEFHYLRVF